MSDPYREATRNERTGMSRIAKVLLFGGGLAVATLAAVWFIWFSFARDRMSAALDEMVLVEAPSAPAARTAAELEEARKRQAELAAAIERTQAVAMARLESTLAEQAARVEVEARAVEAARVAQAARSLQEAQEARALQEVRVAQEQAAAAASLRRQQAVRAEREARVVLEKAAAAASFQRQASMPALPPAQESVAEELTLAVNTAIESVLEDAGVSVDPAGDGNGISFDVRSAEVAVSFDVIPDGALLSRAAHGDGRLADLWPDAAAGGADAAERAPAPEWVPVFPGADRKNGVAVAIDDAALGVAVYLAGAPGHDVVEWYFDAADRLARDGADFSFRQLREEGRPDPFGELGRFAMRWDDRQVSVFVVEDSHGDSVFVVVYGG